MKVDYVDHMGTDLSVVNAARVSFAKESGYEEDGELGQRDRKLIRYLANHNHWTPFGHTSVSVRVRAPLFVARQLQKHQVGLVWNEVSRRYVDDPPEYYEPEDWRGRPENSKQGSSGPILQAGVPFVEMFSEEFSYFDVIDLCDRFYKRLIEAGVCPEQARMVLPQSMYTEWIWTGNLVSFANMCRLRLDAHTQKETREVAAMIAKVVEPLFPVSWKELMNND